MSAELHQRVARAVATIVEEVPVTAPDPAALRARAARSSRARTRLPGSLDPAGAVPGPRSPRWAPLFAALAVGALVVGVVALPGLLSRAPQPRPAAGEPPPVLPQEFAGMSLLTSSVSAMPPGRVIALIRQGALGTRDLGTSQVVVVGADGRTYRRLDLAERRGSYGADQEWSAAEALLGPDGTVAAVGDPVHLRDRFELVDLRTGRATAYPLDRPSSVQPLDWSADGRRLAVAVGDAPLDGSTGTSAAAWLAIVDVTSGVVNRLTGLGPRATGGWVASFSPDAGSIAVTGPAPEEIVVMDHAGAVRRTLTAPDGFQLTSRAAWSPDGSMLVAERTRYDAPALAFLDPTGAGRPVPAPIRYSTETFDLLGWRSPTTMLVGVHDGDYTILAAPVDGGPARPLSRLPSGVMELGRINQVQLADALMATAQIRDAGPARRGPWPWWWRITLAATVLLIGYALRRSIRRRREMSEAGARIRVSDGESPKT